MTNFSDLYVNSPIVQNLLKGIPEEDREKFVESLRQSLVPYDALASFGGKSPEIFNVLRGSAEEIPKEEGRRPPRRR